MDDPKVYGPQSYVLSFGEAARRKIICGYKVIISVITSDQVNDEVLSKGTVSVKGDEVRARQVANQIALRDAVAQYGVGKVFTFHSTVKSAASFVADGNEGVRTHLPEFTALHVSGAMPTARRERVMKEFRSAPKAVMTNARCLTEGVDVPAVDMVAFLSPKKSKVDIVQAIGRAMRRSGSKEVGYVLIPLYLEQKAGETLEEAVARANFEEVWDILQSLQEQDEVLAELIRDMAVAKGSGKGFDDSRFSDRIAFTGPVLALDSIRSAVTTRVLERLESSWDVNFGKLVKFKENHGHCRPKIENNRSLFHWVLDQRKAYNKNNLSHERITALDSLGFEWDPAIERWNKMVSELKEYKSTHGNCRVSTTSKEFRKLGVWVANVRSSYSDGTISAEKIEELENLGFEWDPISADWEKMYEALKLYKAVHGDCRVAATSKTHGKLGRWVSTQRKDFQKKQLPKEKIDRLNDLGFEWNPYSSTWDKMYEALKLYKTKNGDCRVPVALGELGKWVHVQRRNFKSNLLSDERINLLENLGFEWHIIENIWEAFFEELKSFKNQYGHCLVNQRSKTHRKLGIWVLNQRLRYRRGKISADRIAKLEEIGFVWNVISDAWEDHFVELKSFKHKFGHCRVPSGSKDYKELASWVSNLRYNYSKGKISPDKVARLDALGFVWRVIT